MYRYTIQQKDHSGNRNKQTNKQTKNKNTRKQITEKAAAVVT